MEKKVGIKHDGGKHRWHLIPEEALEEVCTVMEQGAMAYGDDNWKSLENLNERCLNAMRRHWGAYVKGNMYDKDTHCHHLAHAICNALFILWNDLTHTVKIDLQKLNGEHNDNEQKSGD